MAELSPANPDKPRALAEKIRDAGELPDEMLLWDADGDDLLIPRGFAHRLETLATDVGEQIEWDSSMTILPPAQHYFRDWPVFELDPDQLLSRDALLDWAQGILQAPTGSGKTAVALETARWAGQKTLIIVGKTALGRQWEEVVRERYGCEPGYIGEGIWTEARITIALWQTLWTRKDIYPEFWAKFGMVIFDEVHHASAASLSRLASRFPAFYRIGLSATPKWDPLLFPIVEAVVGPVVHRAQTERLVTPSVRMYETDFEAEYIETHYVGRKRVQNNFNEVVAKLISDPDRNDLIARVAREEAQAGHHVLIVTRRIEHVKQLIRRLEKTMRVGKTLHVLTGAQTGHDAQRIAKVIESSERGTVTVSTVMSEGFDLPILDRIILAFPTRNTNLVKQEIGRIMRTSPGKEDAVIYDLKDPKCAPLKAQARGRLQMYLKEGYRVETLSAVG